jgi:23S rRNA (cytidine1920-2'-O)/16S rRNA (cytidine1409-2'-O)-methyltransferase
LLQLGLFGNRKTAVGWIMAGKVVVDGVVVTKPGTLVKHSARIFLRGTPLRFASRGGYKLDHALKRFAIAVAGRVCLDAGAAAGGFTDCMLQCGARLVYAVDAGYGQLRGRIANDSRVVSMERTNISALRADQLDPGIEFAAIDLSYLSLAKAVPIVARLFGSQPVEMVCLVKPLYEGLAQHHINDRAALAPVLHDLFANLQAKGFPAIDACVSPILGARGAIEFLAHVRGNSATLGPGTLAARAIEELHQHPPREL